MKHRTLHCGETVWLDSLPLNRRQRFFVLAYLKDPNATEAARLAGYKHPNVQGPRLLLNVRVAAAIKEGQARIEKDLMLDAKEIAKRWADLATADVSELIEHRIGACRYCHGIDHAYQWRTDCEYREALGQAAFDLFHDDDLREAAMRGEIIDHRLPMDDGGYGYRSTADPHPDCPECDGLGIERVRMADTRNLSPAARLLYDGVEVTQNCKKIRVTSREKALENLAKSIGMFAGKVETEETNPLSRLVERIMDSAEPVPVKR